MAEKKAGLKKEISDPLYAVIRPLMELLGVYDFQAFDIPKKRLLTRTEVKHVMSRFDTAKLALAELHESLPE